jgi:hypothetical protein
VRKDAVTKVEPTEGVIEEVLIVDDVDERARVAMFEGKREAEDEYVLAFDCRAVELERQHCQD